MALTATLDGTVVHVVQTTMGFKRSFVEHWYYDLSTLKRSRNGRLGDACDQPMDALSMDWYMKYTRKLVAPVAKAEAYARGLYKAALVQPDWAESDWINYLDSKDLWLVPVH